MSKSFNFRLLANDVDMDNFIVHRPVKEAKPVPVPIKKIVAKPKEKTIKKKQEKESLQALAFGNSGGKTKKKAAASNGVVSAPAVKGNGGSTTTGAKKNKKNSDASSGAPPQQKQMSEDWKNRDQQFIEEENERELREALMLSKLDFEANKDGPQQTKENGSKSSTAKTKKKKDKPITVSLSEFNTMDSRKLSNVNGNNNTAKAHSKAIVDNVRDDNFFIDVDKAVRNTIVTETRQKQKDVQREKQSKNRSNNNNISNNFHHSSNGTGSILVPVSEVEKRDFEIQALRLEVESLKDQLEKVKLRNKKLYEVLGTAEMRTVGEVVIELGKVAKARDELSIEVASLSGQLEQEKTKVSQLQDKHRKK